MKKKTKNTRSLALRSFLRIPIFVLTGAIIIPLLTCGAGLLTAQPQANSLTGKELAAQQQTNTSTQTSTYESVFPVHEPYGTGVGAMPGRVAWAYDPASVNWDGTGYWWETDHFAEPVIQQMVDDSIASLGGANDVKSGWEALFRAHNAQRNKSTGYQAGEKIAIKANMNGMGTFGDNSASQMSYTNPVLLKTLLLSLVEEAGVAPSDITIYDASRVFPDEMIKMCSSGKLSGVQFRYLDLGGSNNAQPDQSVPVVWSQPVSGDTNYLPQSVTEAEYLINLANLKGHSYGITLCGKNHFGTIMNSNRLRPPEAAGIHRYLTQNRMNAYTVLVDLLANYQLGEKTVLYMLDGLICAPSEGASISGDNSRWQQTPFNGGYTASVLMSQDPVALDSVGADFLINEPTVTSRNGTLENNPNVENYLHEAGLVAAPPSGADYRNGNGEKVTNLGVHEHWNNPIDKQYSRNLGASEGIELVRVGKGDEGSEPEGTSTFVDVPAGAWYAEAVEYCQAQGLMNGTSAIHFAPQAITSRAMLVTILHNQAGKPESNQSVNFTDVPANAWYRTPLFWATENRIVNGYNDGSFGSNDPVTREQIAVILWRRAGSPDIANQQLTFADQSELSSFARTAAAWAHEQGIINGKEGNRFDPKGLATRAETAVMLYRYVIH